MAITLLITESLAIIRRGSPVAKLTAMPATLTNSISRARTFSSRRATRPVTDRPAGTTLLRARDSHRLRPSPACSR